MTAQSGPEARALRTITGRDLGPQLHVYRPDSGPADRPIDLTHSRGNKPAQGRWSSTLRHDADGPGSGWVDLCRNREPRWLSHEWRVQMPAPDAALLHITCLDDLTDVIDAYPMSGCSDAYRVARVIDFAAVAAAGWAGIHLDEAAVLDCCVPGKYGAVSGARSRDRYGQDQLDLTLCALKEWECQSVLWLRDDALTTVGTVAPPHWWSDWDRNNAAVIHEEQEQRRAQAARRRLKREQQWARMAGDGDTSDDLVRATETRTDQERAAAATAAIEHMLGMAETR